MSIETPDRTATRKHTIEPVQRTTDPGGWWDGLGPRGRKAYKAAFAGYSLDAFDLIMLTLTLAAIGTTFGVGKGATGALATVTLSASAVGGIGAGIICDRIGRARTLMITVGVYPTRARGTGAGFCYKVGRALGALFPGIIGFLAAAIGLGGAVAFGVFGYVLAIFALRFLPETHGRELVPVE